MLQKSSPEEIEVQLKVFSNLIPSPKQIDIVADLDLSHVKEGTNNLAIRSDDIKLPPGVIIAGLDRSSVRVVTDKKISRQMTIKVQDNLQIAG